MPDSPSLNRTRVDDGRGSAGGIGGLSRDARNPGGSLFGGKTQLFKGLSQCPAAIPSLRGSEPAAHPLGRRRTAWAPPNEPPWEIV